MYVFDLYVHQSYIREGETFGRAPQPREQNHIKMAEAPAQKWERSKSCKCPWYLPERLNAMQS
jgi:hypothetical protein